MEITKRVLLEQREDNISIDGEQQLFRLEALTARSSQWLGPIRLATPISYQIWAVSALSVCLLFCAWAVFGTYTRREHVSGVLVPKAGLLTLVARESGTVSKVGVREGEIVHSGQGLMTLIDERKSTSLGDVSGNISSQLQQQIARLQRALADTRRLADEQVVDLRMQDTMLSGELGRLDDEIAIQRKQVGSLTSLLTKFQPLREKGYVSPLAGR